MAVRHGYGKIAGTDALVFAYDTGDTRNSYKGEPTENLITNPLPTSTTGFSRSGGTGTVTYDNTKNAVYWEQTAYATWGAYFNFFPAFTGTLDVNSQYTFSVEYYNQSDFAETGINYNLVQGNGQSGATYYNNITPKVVEIGGGWKRFTHTFTPANSGVSAAYNRFIVGNKDTDVLRLWFRNIQFEKKPHRTQFTTGTRSVSGSLLDLTGNRTIDLSNVNFDSNANMVFDGTDDEFSIGTGLGIQNASFSLEAMVKWDGGSTDTFFGYRGTTDATQQSIHWRIYSTGQLRFDFYSNSINSGTGQIVANEWVHLLVTYDYDSDTCVCYKNGTLLMQGNAGPYTGADSTSTGYIGSWGPNNQHFGGDIPVFKIFNRALTAAEVQSNYRHYKNRFGI